MKCLFFFNIHSFKITSAWEFIAVFILSAASSTVNSAYQYVYGMMAPTIYLQYPVFTIILRSLPTLLDCQHFMWSVCPCWPPLFFCLGGGQIILEWQRKIFHHGEKKRERVCAPVALIYSIRNGETSEIECGGKKSQTITCPRRSSLWYTLRQTNTNKGERLRKVAHVKLCPNAYIIYCIHHQRENKWASSRGSTSFRFTRLINRRGWGETEADSRAGGPIEGLIDTMHLNMNTVNQSMLAERINTVCYKNKGPFSAISHLLHLWLKTSSDLTSHTSDQCCRKRWFYLL